MLDAKEETDSSVKKPGDAGAVHNTDRERSIEIAIQCFVIAGAI